MSIFTSLVEEERFGEWSPPHLAVISSHKQNEGLAAGQSVSIEMPNSLVSDSIVICIVSGSEMKYNFFLQSYDVRCKVVTRVLSFRTLILIN